VTHWSPPSMGEIMVHRRYETFELPEAEDRLLASACYHVSDLVCQDRSGG
jgi:hypothetical protein